MIVFFFGKYLSYFKIFLIQKMADDDGQKDEAENVVEVDADGNTVEVPPNSPKKRKLTSKVWKDFDKMKGRDGSESAKCFRFEDKN